MKINLNGLIYTFAATTLLFASCNDELEENKNYIPVVEGDEIFFGASDLATFEDGYSDNIPQSRTSYGEATWDGEKWLYPLNWVYGDQVAVYCKQSPDNKKYTTYKIQWDGGSEGDIVDGNNNSAYLLRVGENGIHWGNVNEEHEFFAFYPASAIQNDFVGGVVKGVIPNAQDVSWSQDNDGNWVGKPNMNYAFMRAYNKVVPTQVKDGKVALTFQPLTTAIDVILTAKTDVTISAVQVSSRSKDGLTQQSVCGDFEYNIGTGHTTVGNPDVATDYRVTVSCWHDDGSGNQVPIELKANRTLKFTVFLLPGSDANGDRILHNLEIRVPGWNNGLRAKYYKNLNLQVGTKSQVYLPEYEPNGSSNNWIGSLPGNVYISQLSIPGSVNAFSDFVNDENGYNGPEEMDQTQTLSVEEQFAYGVRAFEIATERSSTESLKDAKIIAGEKTSITLEAALQRLADLVNNNPSEFVIAMPYYAPDATSVPETWSKQLKTYLQGISNINGVEIKPFDNSMTISEAQGKILFLSRMPGDKKSVDGWVGAPQKTTAIYSWDSDKNRWKRRGYDVTLRDYWVFDKNDKSTEQWNGESDPKGANYNIDNVNWLYEAASPTGAPEFYIQDWFRVCKAPGEYYHVLTELRSSHYWYESKTEKIDNIKNFMAQTIGELKKDVSGSKVFINSLAGYYIVSDGPALFHLGGVSALPYPTLAYPNYGKHGDIPTFAFDMNNEIYNSILDLDYESRGPLGIVLINYAGAKTAFGMNMRGDYIVKALVDNNFRFPLLGE